MTDSQFDVHQPDAPASGKYLPLLVQRAGAICTAVTFVLAMILEGHGAEALDAKEVKNSLGMKLVYIPPGKFTMGSPETEAGREAQETPHEVELTNGFYMGVHEVTVGQFKQFVADTKYQTDGDRDGKGAYGANEAGKIEEMHSRFNWKTPGFEQTDDHPVVDVSWSDAKAFCNWLSEKEKKTYRMATEAEWEYTCRAGTTTAYAHGDDPEGLATGGNGADATARAKFPAWSIGIKGQDGHLFTAPVGQFKANPFGLYDMHGNVWEWCEDWYVPNGYSNEKQVDPTGPATGKAKVQRGGGWSSDFKRLRSAARIGRDWVAYRGCYQGFRVVLEKGSERAAQPAGTGRDAVEASSLRIQTQGNSWSYNVSRLRAIEKAAGIPEGTYYPSSEVIDGKPGPVYFPGCLNGEKKPARETTTLKTRLVEQQIEVFTYTHSGWHETDIADEIAEFGSQHNPKFKLLWQAGWNVHDGLGISKNGPVRDAVKIADLQAALDKNRQAVEARVEAINKKLGKTVVYLVPVGDAFVKLRAMVVDGQFPGVKKQSELYNDDMPHQGRLGSLLQDYCVFAALYHRSPEGLKVTLDPAISEEQAALLQKIAWETVSKYPPAGVARVASTNPQVSTSRDAKLDKEFEYLVFDLGRGVELRLVKVKAQGQTFRIGSSKQEQEAVNAKYFNGKQQGKLAMEDEHAVTLTDDFYLGQFEVTRGQFRRFVEATGYQTIPELTDGGKGWDAKEQKFVGAVKRFSWRDTGLDFQTDDYPVVNVAIDDAREFCKWLLKNCDGRVKIREVRLPGEAEWEFACRAGSQTRFHFGDDDEQLVEFANVADAAAREKNLAPVTLNGRDGFPFSAPVGRLKPNPFGLYDMHGNVWEFCEDHYGKYAALPKEHNALQTVVQGEIRPVMRGGAWHLTGSDCRCANRFIVGSTGRYATGGFRVLCMP